MSRIAVYESDEINDPVAGSSFISRNLFAIAWSGAYFRKSAMITYN